MDIHNLAQRREAPGVQRHLANDQSPQNGAQFRGTLSRLEGQGPRGAPGSPDEGSEQRTASSAQAQPELNEQEKLQAERIARFGSFTAYSLWRKIPVMAMGIMQPKDDATFEKHGLLEEWHKQRDAWQGKVASMTESEREATGANVLDPPPAAATSAADPSLEVTETVAAAQSQAAAPSEHALAAPPSTAATSPTGSDVSGASQPQIPQTEVEATDPARAPQVEETVAEVGSGSPGEVSESNQTSTAVQAQATQPVKTQEELRAELLERFGSYTAYSLWRKIPVMAMGIMQPKDDATFEKHGLLEEWHKQRDAWQGKVSSMSEAERAATGATVLDAAPIVAPATPEQPVEAAGTVAEAQSQDGVPSENVPPSATSTPVNSSPVQSDGSSQSQPTATPMAADAVDPPPVLAVDRPAETTDTVTPGDVADSGEAATAVQSQQTQPVKSQEELQAERIERFGSYTAYSLWRKIPVMAMGIMQPKDDATFEKHGLLEEWHKQRDAWQGKVGAMSEEERAATGTSLLDTTPVADQAAPVATDVAAQAETQDSSVDTPVPPAEQADQVAGTAEPDEADAPEQPAVSIVQEIEEAKTQEELRAELLERFGSYTAYSLWRKIPVMAMGIMQPKDDSTFEQHGLLEYWQAQRDQWQGKVRTMSEAQRVATGASLLDES